MKIGKFSALADVSIRTVHHYESIGLIPTANREGKYRVYSATDLKRMEFIKTCKEFELTLKEISELMHFFDKPSETWCKAAVSVVHNKMAQVNQDLVKKRTQLERLENLELRIQSILSSK
ncbi:MerR family transcriptional regulator [Reinekea sp.]|uniref:MerR family transcriptional regulator n=1 Tax=Reinekea sp. TaxID=1970455 RepID=UPI0039895AC7